jgi:hypothetical protein
MWKRTHILIFSRGGRYTPITPTIETYQASFTMIPTHDEHHSDTQDISILSMQDQVILKANNIYLQSSKDDFKAYIHLHGIDMQIHSIPKSQKQKAQYMELPDLHHEEFKIFALEYNTSSN